MLKPPAVIFSSSTSKHQSFPTKYILKEETLNNLHYLRLPDKVGSYTDVTDLLNLLLHLACKVTCYFWLFSSVLVSILRTSINVLSKSKSRNCVTWIANLTKLFLSVYTKSLVNTNLFSTNFSSTHFQKASIPHLTRTMKQKSLH